MAQLQQKRSRPVTLELPARPRRKSLVVRPLPTLIPVGGGPLRRLAWIFGFGR